MTQEGGQNGFPATGPAGDKPGWYRNRASGQRRYWNGSAWSDLADAITPFTFEPAPPAAPPPPPAEDPPSPPSAAQGRSFDKRTQLIGLSVAAVIVFLAVMGLITLNNKSAPLSTSQSPPSTSLPSGTTVTTPITTTTSSLDPTTTSVPPATTTTFPNPGTAGPGGTSPLVGNAVTKVAIIGDSISKLAEPDLTHALREYTLVIDAVGGTTMSEHLSTIEAIEGDGQNLDWVVELGTNDALKGNDNWSSDFTNEIGALQTQRCVVLVTVNPRFGPISTGINEGIANAVATHANFHSLDWGNIELRNPQWLSDGIHPSKSGRAELAKLEHRAILGCQGG
jgi:lysophospholipase L1-like esterase